jgi:hypothetical protein
VALRTALRYYGLGRIIAGLNSKTQQGVVKVGEITLDVRAWIDRLTAEQGKEYRALVVLGFLPDPESLSGWAGLTQADVTGFDLAYIQE